MDRSFESISEKSILIGLFSPVIAFLGIFLGSLLLLMKGGGGTVVSNLGRFILTDLVGLTPNQLRVIALHPVESIFMYLKLSVWLGTIGSIIVIPYYWLPIIPEFTEENIPKYSRTERMRVSSGTAVLFLIGVLYGYLFIISVLIIVRNDINGDYVISYQLRKMYDLLIFLPLSFGIATVLPAAWYWFWRKGIVSYRLIRKRWYVVLSSFVLFALVGVPNGIFLKGFWLLHPIVIFAIMMIYMSWSTDIG